MKESGFTRGRVGFPYLLKHAVPRTLFACIYEETNRVALLLKRSVTNRSA
jgi:hypothetical protein